jgi:hypothetical protein
MFSPNPAPSTAGSGYTRARTPQGGMSPTALSALFPTAMTGEGLTATEVASQRNADRLHHPVEAGRHGRMVALSIGPGYRFSYRSVRTSGREPFPYRS